MARGYTRVALSNCHTSRLSAHPTVAVPLWLTAGAHFRKPGVSACLLVVHSFHRHQEVGAQETLSATPGESGGKRGCRRSEIVSAGKQSLIREIVIYEKLFRNRSVVPSKHPWKSVRPWAARRNLSCPAFLPQQLLTANLVPAAGGSATRQVPRGGTSHAKETHRGNVNVYVTTPSP